MRHSVSKSVSATIVLACTLAAAHPAAAVFCGDDLDCVRQRVAAHEVKRAGFWRAFHSVPIGQRVFGAPTELLDYLSLDNRLREFPNRPEAADLDPHILQDLHSAIDGIPGIVKTLVDQRLMGIFLVRNLGGTGYTDYVFDVQDAIGAFVVLDAEVLTETANAWATWKENTPFTADASFNLRAIIEDAADDNRQQALQYILLHEFGHVASVGTRIHPPWDGWDCKAEPPRRFPFFHLSWRLKDAQDCTVESKFDQSIFRHRAQVVYYFGANLGASESPEVYAELDQTNFPSLYGATSPADDFAESFVTYVHTVLMDKPFEIHIDQANERLTTFTGCWGTARCSAKQALLEELFRTPR